MQIQIINTSQASSYESFMGKVYTMISNQLISVFTLNWRLHKGFQNAPCNF